jgi:Galactose oxidase, central domain
MRAEGEGDISTGSIGMLALLAIAGALARLLLVPGHERLAGRRWPRMTVGLSAVALSWALIGGGQAWASISFTPLTAASQSLNEARDRPIAAALPDGQVLMAGGHDHSFLASAELFNPATDTLSKLTGPEQSLITAREGAVAATLPNGQVLIAGGSMEDLGVLSSAELFNPTTDTFSKLEGVGRSLTEARYDAVAATLPNGQVLIAGGEGEGRPGTTAALSSAELFNPTTDTFTTLNASGPSQRHRAVAATLPSGLVLIAGGSYGASGAELFNPATDTFTGLAGGGHSPTTGREGAVTATLPNGQVLIAGGDGRPLGESLSSAELFNPVTDTFTALTGAEQSLTEPRENAIAVTLPSGEILIADGDVIAGTLAFAYIPFALSSAELFNPATDTFTRLTGIGHSLEELRVIETAIQGEAEAEKREEREHTGQEEAPVQKRLGEEAAARQREQEEAAAKQAGMEKQHEEQAAKKKKKKKKKKKSKRNKRRNDKKRSRRKTDVRDA